MPQVIDVAPTRSTAPRAERGVRPAEPRQRFDEVLNRRSKPEAPDEPKPEKTDESDPSGKASKPEKTNKSEARKKKSEDEAPECESSVETPSETDEKPEAVAEAVEVPTDTVEIASDEETPDAKNPEKSPVDPTIDPSLAAVQTPVQTIATTPTESTEAQADRSEAVAGVPSTQLPADPQATEPETDAAAPIRLPVEAKAEDADEEIPDADGVIAAAKPSTESAGKAPHQTPATDLPVPTDVVPKSEAPKPAPLVHTVQQPVAPERHFAENNVDRIVTSVRGEMLPTGGTMKIRLDPPNLGELNIDVTVTDGVLNASFQTTTDDATRLLSHSLQQLKSALETAGVSVDRIQVKQAASTDQASNQSPQDREQQQNPHDHAGRQEQQRREMLQKMWRRFSLGEEPLDLVA